MDLLASGGIFCLQKVGGTLGQWTSAYVYLLFWVLYWLLGTQWWKNALRTGIVYTFDTDTLKCTMLTSMCPFAAFILGNNNKYNMEFSESGLSSPSSVFSHLLSDSTNVIIIVTFNTLFWDFLLSGPPWPWSWDPPRHLRFQDNKEAIDIWC